ncbi:ABC transporter ATP-binding protein [Aestuariivirga sp. YIM B02566]|uniref:ABC transporter ATP-binding protein n=1 Tax=Taklimakanibacter albus TaxID=2800327 RepID=A0ACC5R2R4_9HYPH|nr:ABC transporter ATP-binding protein [Aestuariivirga sp. YIM B02566]MBK1866924.1 ABC transporter ATP-binding protein [Aestuariivirga sp. YIM B02566]
MASVSLNQVSKSYGAVDIIRAVDLAIADGEFVVFVGPSGCGKSTLLRLIAGLVPVSSGDISIADEDMTEVPASKRGIAIVFQSYALYPHMTIARNIGFALETSGLGKPEIKAKVTDIARMLKIDHLLGRYPRQLSGGQRQRVAIGRALVRQPKVFLFDEPLSNLDTDLRAEMRVEIARLHEELGTTMVYVTHDQIEAMTLADRIVVLNEGRIEQIGTPQELYRQPANQFVAGFIGSPRMNFVAGALLGEKARGATTLGVRPEAIRLVPAEEAHVSGTLLRLEDLGHEHLAYVEIARDITWTVRLAAHPDRERGAMVGLGWAEEALYRFGTDGRAVA